MKPYLISSNRWRRKSFYEGLAVGVLVGVVIAWAWRRM